MTTDAMQGSSLSQEKPLQSINQSINQSFIYSKKKKTIIDKYNEKKLNKTNNTLKCNVDYYLL